AADSNISFIYLENPNSTLVLDSTNAGGSIKFTANNASIYGRNSGTSVAEDLSGTIKKNAVTRSITIEGSKSLGYDSTHRLLSLQIAGDSSTTIDAIVYSADITVKNSAGTVTFKRGVDQGTNCTLNLERSASFAPTTPATWKLSGTTAIKTTHNGSDASGGQLILSGGSTVDLSGATTLTVEVKGSSTLPPSGTEYSYKLFDNSSGGAITAPSVSTTFTNSDSQSLIKWNYDPATYTLSSTTDTSGIVVAAAGGGGGGATIAAALVAADNTGNDVARRILSDIGLLSPERIGDSLRMLLTSDPTSTSASETFDVVGSTLNNRMGEFIAEGGVVELWGGTWELQEVRTEGLRGADAPPDVIQGGTGELQEVRTEGLQEGTGVQGGGLTPGDWGVSAGDDTTAVTKHGVWANYVYYAATQKTVGQNNGYKTINQGNTIGYDYMIGEGNTMGLAYSQFHSRFKESAFKSGNKGKTKTHSIHLYGIKDLFVRRHDLFITYNAGLGFGKVQNSQQRLITRNVTRFADSKYNSNIYSGSATLGKRINLRNKLMVIPTAGLSYNQFNDGGYSETGAGTQNLRVSKKTSYGLDGALGVSTRYSCLHSKTGITLEPSIFAKTFINLKDKAPIMYISSDAFLAPVRIDGTKKNSAWYQFGAGLNMKKNSWDCSFSYDVSLDKKYVGHQGAIKVRVNM
ncbi:MAG: autotransporter outer membrane beta-barrel domain-containing protein, partial [Pseudomonadota bacterium]